MKSICQLTFLFVFISISCLCQHAVAQNTLEATLTVQDTTATKNNTDADAEAKWGIKISRDALPNKIVSHAQDSILLDAKQKKIYLYGDTKIEYDDLSLSSGITLFDNEKKEVTAYPSFDTAGKKISKQEFIQGQEKFNYDTLRYNFNSKRAIVRNARMQYGEGFIQSQQIKRNQDESIYGWKSIYTTCNIPDHPHFAIRANKIKVIPNRMVVSGPANVEIQEIPTPVFLPFGMFPTSKTQKSGFILPSYTMENNRGLGLQRGGYFLMINPHVNTLVQMDIFSKGSWAIFNTSQYAKRYKYSGRLELNYSYTQWGEEFELGGQRTRDFKVRWSHQMDQKSRPGTNFSASVDVGTSNYNIINGMNANTVLNNQYSSSISYSKNWVGKPYSFSAALRHSQSTQTGLVSVNLPDINFTLGQFTPFQRKMAIGNPKWYEKFNVSYSVDLSNRIIFYDSLINHIQVGDFYNGLRHNVRAQANYNILKYFTLSFNIPYTEYWNTKQEFISQLTAERDTTTKHGFFTAREFNTTVDMSTRVYGMFGFKKGPITAIRHVIMPTVGLNYKPSFARDPFNYMYTQVDTNGKLYYYSPYTGSPIGGPGNYTETGAITFSLNNTLQAKRRIKDSTSSEDKRIINLIDGFSINGSYNMIADTNKLSDLAMNFRTLLFGKLNLSSNANFTPYKHEKGQRTRHYLWDTDKKIVQLNTLTLNLGISFDGTNKDRGTEKDTTNLGNEEDNDVYKNLMKNKGYEDYYDFNIPWNLSINGGVRLGRIRSRQEGIADSFILTPNLTFNGGVNLTERWKINVTSGLDFQNMKQIKLGYTQINVVRDLHCWQASLNLVPFGQLRSFYFTLQVKASVLQDLKLTRRRSFQDNY